MTPSIKREDLAGFNLVMWRRLHNRILEKCRESGITRAEFTRRALAQAVGDPDLAQMPRKIGRQKEGKPTKRNGRNGEKYSSRSFLGSTCLDCCR